MVRDSRIPNRCWLLYAKDDGPVRVDGVVMPEAFICSQYVTLATSFSALHWMGSQINGERHCFDLAGQLRSQLDWLVFSQEMASCDDRIPQEMVIVSRFCLYIGTEVTSEVMTGAPDGDVWVLDCC